MQHAHQIYYRWYPWSREGMATRRLSLEALGFYWHLVDYIASHGSVPCSVKILRNITGCDPRVVRRLLEEVEPLLTRVDDSYTLDLKTNRRDDAAA